MKNDIVLERIQHKQAVEESPCFRSKKSTCELCQEMGQKEIQIKSVGGSYRLYQQIYIQNLIEYALQKNQSKL